MQTFISIVLAFAGFAIAMAGGERNSPLLLVLGIIVIAIAVAAGCKNYKDDE